MRVKLMLSTLTAALLFIFVFSVRVEAGLEPVNTVDSLITAVNAGDLDAAMGHFSADATAIIKMTNRSYANAAEIDQFLRGLYREGREYEIVRLTMVGETVTLTVDIADHGHVWGQQRMKAQVHNGMIDSLEIVETRLTLWRISG